MNDPYNPTLDEIRAWAYSDEQEPCQDWDIIAFDKEIDAPLLSLLLSVAADPACAKKDDFLHFLYVVTGSVVRAVLRGEAVARRTESLGVALEQAASRPDPRLALWAGRSRAVLAAPETFLYDDWFSGPSA